MIRILFLLVTFLGSAALLIAAQMSGAWVVTSTVIAEQSWVSLLFTYGVLTTILSLMVIVFEFAAFIHRKPAVVVNKGPYIGKPVPSTDIVSKDYVDANANINSASRPTVDVYQTDLTKDSLPG